MAKIDIYWSRVFINPSEEELNYSIRYNDFEPWLHSGYEDVDIIAGMVVRKALRSYGRIKSMLPLVVHLMRPGTPLRPDGLPERLHTMVIYVHPSHAKRHWPEYHSI